MLPIFSTPVVKINIDRDFTEDELQLCITDIPMMKNKGATNHQSKDLYLFDTFAEELKHIKKFCEDELKQYMEDVEGADTNLTGLRITQSWLNKNKSSEQHPPHFHLNSYLSGVLYIKCLPNDHINFDNRMYGMFNNMEFPKKKITEWNSYKTVINIEEGDLILFPSWIPHSVDVNTTKDNERISLSFNTFPIGEMGYYYGSHLKL
jgi:uncharacterized protein (TIGR02466 family)